MTVQYWISIFIRVALVLLIAGKLGRVTYDYAVKMAHEQQLGLISLTKLSKELRGQ